MWCLSIIIKTDPKYESPGIRDTIDDSISRWKIGTVYYRDPQFETIKVGGEINFSISKRIHSHNWFGSASVYTWWTAKVIDDEKKKRKKIDYLIKDRI